jgi:hypothetical protein
VVVALVVQAALVDLAAVAVDLVRQVGVVKGDLALEDLQATVLLGLVVLAV